jgi:predicted ATPase
VLQCLAALVDNSLLQRDDRPDNTPRLAMLETVRQYAAEQLVAHGEEEAARRRHAEYYLAQVEATGGLLFAGPALRARGAAEQHNIHTALTWLVRYG